MLGFVNQLAVFIFRLFSLAFSSYPVIAIISLSLSIPLFQMCESPVLCLVYYWPIKKVYFQEKCSNYGKLFSMKCLKDTHMYLQCRNIMLLNNRLISSVFIVSQSLVMFVHMLEPLEPFKQCKWNQSKQKQTLSLSRRTFL